MKGAGSVEGAARKREKLVALVITVVTAIISPCSTHSYTHTHTEREREVRDDICRGGLACNIASPRVLYIYTHTYIRAMASRPCKPANEGTVARHLTPNFTLPSTVTVARNNEG